MTHDVSIYLRRYLYISFLRHSRLMPGQRYIRLFTEPPKRECDWQSVVKDIEDALRKNVQRVQQKAGTSEGKRESIYLGDTGEVSVVELMKSAERLNRCCIHGNVHSPTSK